MQPVVRSWDAFLFVVDRNEKNVSVGPARTVASVLESWAAAASASALADANLQYISDRQL